MNERIKALLEKLAARELHLNYEDLPYTTAYDVSGGNFDDAFYLGSEDGQTELARQILKMLNNS